jgi:hypothetical protein
MSATCGVGNACSSGTSVFIPDPRFLVEFMFLDIQVSVWCFVNHYLSFSLFLFLLAIALSVDLQIQIILFGIF